MDKAQRKNILLGLFVITGIFIFIIGIFLVGSKNELFKKTITISTRFTNATGLKPGCNIRFNGVRVGIVKSVTLLNDSLVQVDMSIEDSKRGYIPNTAIASIASDGLMGDKIVNITGGKSGGTPIKENETLQSHNPLVTDQVLQTLNTTNENIKVISENLKKLTSDLNTENGTIQALYKDPEMAVNLKKSLSNLDAVTGKVLTVSGNLQQITYEIQNGNGAVGRMINDTALGDNIAYTLSKLKETSDQLNSFSGQLSATIQQVNSGKGTASLLLNDTTFSSNIRQSMANIKAASQKIDENMEALKHNFLTRGYFRKQARKNKAQHKN